MNETENYKVAMEFAIQQRNAAQNALIEANVNLYNAQKREAELQQRVIELEKQLGEKDNADPVA